MTKKTKVKTSKKTKMFNPVKWALLGLSIYFVYLNVRVHNLSTRQDNIATVLLGSISNQDVEKIKTHSIEILQKISNYQPVGNEYLDNSILELYGRAYEIAQKGDKSYFYFENMADGMLLAYKQGALDGNKMWNKKKIYF